MPEITPIQPNQTSEARRVIYEVAHALFGDRETLEESIAHYQVTWPLRDIEDYQRRYIEQDGAFFVMTEGGRIIGTGGLWRLVELGAEAEPTCEIKRVWLLPAYQGQGLGYRMMMHLLAVAREKGYTRVRLETSPAYQARAVQFYKQLGFYEIPRYGDDPDDIGMELILQPSTQEGRGGGNSRGGA